MTAKLSLYLETLPFERAPADLAIACFFHGERPPRDAAGRADWRLCGLVSDLLEEGRLPDKTGEAVLVPALGRMLAPRVLLLGAGRRSSLGTSRIHEITASAVRRGILLDARRLAFAPPAGAESPARHAETLLRAALSAVLEADARVELGLVIPPEEAPAVKRAFEEALAAEASPAAELLTGSVATRGPSSNQGVPTGLPTAKRF